MLAPAFAPAAPPPDGRGWLGEELPLPLAVRTAQDLAVKAAAEKQYLIFNLLAGGKLAWDQRRLRDRGGEVGGAAARPRSRSRDRQGDPPAREGGARARGRRADQRRRRRVATTDAGSDAATPPAGTGRRSRARRPPLGTTVSGTVSGGGSHGPGGAVIWLKRVGGETPKPAPARGKVVTQRNKTFIPHVLVVPVGTKVSFRNEDPIFHNVFSLSKPNDFDTGLYKQGATYQQTFKRAGVVQILCNIHSSMLGVIVVVDTPYYAQADGSGRVHDQGRAARRLRAEGVARGVVEADRAAAQRRLGRRRAAWRLQVGGDKRPPQFVPDKSGKPRQSHIGY